ncbi:Pre-rRNA-processing protein TSR2-domain-containing protein [Infundibulicybe gibba]|nr:Pre-rRNA-processing protein TSR2-domain-containing protein [Infundibulicybe gibba]
MSSETHTAPPPRYRALGVWATLRLAVQEGWGGHGANEKRTWLASVIVDSFEEQIPAPDEQYVEELLLQVMADEFETILEDGSAEGVAKDIVHMWDDSRAGKADLVLKFEELANKMKGKKTEAQEGITSDDDEWDDDEEGEDSEEEENPPTL